jgi:hypothetical protein
MKTGILLIHCVSTSHYWSLVTELPTDGGFTARMASEKPAISRGAIAAALLYSTLPGCLFRGPQFSCMCSAFSCSCQLPTGTRWPPATLRHSCTPYGYIIA